MSYEFSGCLYDTQAQLLQEVAWSWITASGANSGPELLELLADMSDEYLADECIKEWQLADTSDREESQMDTWGIDRQDIVTAMADFRAKVAAE